VSTVMAWYSNAMTMEYTLTCFVAGLSQCIHVCVPLIDSALCSKAFSVTKPDCRAGSGASLASASATSSHKAQRNEVEQTRSRHPKFKLQPSHAFAEDFASPQQLAGQDSTSGTDSFMYMTAESDHVERMATKQSGSLYAIDVAAGRVPQFICLRMLYEPSSESSFLFRGWSI
jgi:hypothetical protein